MCDCDELWWWHCVEKRRDKVNNLKIKHVSWCVGVWLRSVSLPQWSHCWRIVQREQWRKTNAQAADCSHREEWCDTLHATFTRQVLMHKHELHKKLLWAGTIILTWPGCRDTADVKKTVRKVKIKLLKKFKHRDVKMKSEVEATSVL